MIMKCDCCDKVILDFNDFEYAYPVEFCSESCEEIWEQGQSSIDASAIEENRYKRIMLARAALEEVQ